MTYPVTRFDRVATVQARIGWKALTADEYVDDGYVFLATPNIKSDLIDFQNVNFITRFRYDESPELKLQPGDVLLVKDGNTLGITNLVRSLPRPATVNGSIAVIRTESMHAPYLRYVLASDLIQGRIQAYRAGMGVPHLFQEDIRKFPLPEPPFLTQRAIAEYLDVETSRIDMLVAAEHRRTELASTRLISAIQALVLGREDERSIRNRESGPFVPVRDGWGLRRNKTYMREIVALSAKGDEELLTVSHITGVTTRADKEVTMFLAESNEGYKQVDAGDLVINTMWAWMGALGVSRIAGIVSPAYGVYRFVDPDADPRFFDALFRSPAYVTEMTRHSKGVWTSRLRLYPEAFLAIRTPFPPRAQQTQIADAVEELRLERSRQVRLFERSIELLMERRQALITAVVTGQIEIPGVAA